MPSPKHETELERVLTRAAEEVDSGHAWFGEGLPQALRRALEVSGEASGEPFESAQADVAFVELSPSSPPSAPPAAPGRVVALSMAALEELPSLTRAVESASFEIARLVCPFAVFDFSKNGIRVREVRHGLTAADLQRELDAPLWSGPDLKELGSH